MFESPVGIQTPELRKVPYRTFQALRGSPLLKFYNHSVRETLEGVFPEIDWKTCYDTDLHSHVLDDHLTKRKQVRRNHWSSKYNQRVFFDLLVFSEAVRSHADWYNITTTSVRKRGGSAILNLYKGSLFTALVEIYPEIKWEPWRFRSCPRNFWKNRENLIFFLEKHLAPAIGIINPEDWYRVSLDQVRESGGLGVVTIFGNLGKILKFAYPERCWDMGRFQRKKKQSVQRLLVVHTREIFGLHFILEEYKHPNLI
eukprot:TRINITY_DN5028_c0_g1_i6.p1 TRINITY_DN5028_c0_g1~~TRINITY_DN5028_c0_g1_i6.p1  ORF type:complete len:256 (-),score=29.90 TRINITY_DN5028_c0_g1_i6:309-1076(-)